MSLGNVLSAREGDEPISFISSKDVDMYRKLKGPAFEVQVTPRFRGSEGFTRV